MAPTPPPIPQGWKQNSDPNKSNIYEANIKPINVSTGTIGTIYTVAETNKTNGSYTVYSTSGINFIGGRTPIYTVSSSGARSVDPRSKNVYQVLEKSGEVAKLDDSIKPRAFQINQTVGTPQEKATVANSTLYKSQANKTNQGEQNSQTGSKDSGILKDIDQKGLNESIAAKNTKQSFPGAGGKKPLQYPLNPDPNQDYIMFLMYEYSPREFLGNEGVGFGDRINRSKDESQNIIGSVALPIHPTISDTNVVNWQEQTFDWKDNMFGKISLGAILGGTGGAEEAAAGVAGDITKNSEAYKTAVAVAAAKAAVGGNSNFLTKTTGAIVNPNAELLFNGPGLRTFTFTFSLSARDDQEAISIRKIIRFFKQGMAARRAKSSLFLKSPNTFGIKYYHNGKEHPWINKIKECALQNFSVNYTPLGNYATYHDGSMVQYDLTMNFGELDPIYDDDYLNVNPNTIGY